MRHEDVPVPAPYLAGEAPDPELAEPVASIAHGQRRLIEFAFRAGYVQGYETREDEENAAGRDLAQKILDASRGARS